MDMRNRNNNLHFHLEVSDGTSFGETCRNSLGGWQNMETRINERFGRTMNDDDRLRVSDTSGPDSTFTVAGFTVTATAVQKL